MYLTETDFYRLYGAHEQFRDTLVFAWFDWRKKQDKEWNPGKGYKVEYDWKTGEVVATSKFGEDRFPASYEVFDPNPDKIDMLWYDSYYDGPLSGLAMYKGTYYWFSIEEGSYDNIFNVWTYGLYEIDSKNVGEEIKWYNRFILDVKKSSDPDGERADQYYKDREKNKKEIDYTKNKCIGVFDECLFNRKYKEDEV